MRCFERGILNVVAAMGVMLAVTGSVIFAYMIVVILMLQALILFTTGVCHEA